MPSLTRAEEFRQQFQQARTAGNQIVVTGAAVDDVLMDSESRALPFLVLLRQLCRQQDLALVRYAPRTPIEVVPPTALDLGGLSPFEDPDRALATIVGAIQAAARPTVVVIDFADLALPAGSPLDGPVGPLVKVIQEVATDTVGWSSAGNTMVLVDRGGGILTRATALTGMHVAILSAPQQEERLQFIQQRQRSTKSAPMVLAEDLSPSRAANLSGGLLLNDVHGMALRSSTAQPITTDMLSEFRGQVLQRASHGNLEVMMGGAPMSDVAGMENVKLLLQRLLLVNRSSEQIVLVGPPGTGKTWCAQAIARALGIPLVALRQIMGEGLLGQAERNAERVHSLLHAWAPVGLFADEVDQGPLRARSAGGQTSSEAYLSLRATLLNLTSDPASKISVIATSNVGSHLDPAAVSRMRFLPVLFATASELTTILHIQARRSGVTLGADPTSMFEEYLSTGKVLDGRSCQRILDKAHMLAREQRKEAIEHSHLEQALRNKISNDLTRGALYSTLDALLMADDADALPWIAARTLNKPASVPPYLREFVDSDLTLNSDAVRTKLDALRQGGVYA